MGVDVLKKTIFLLAVMLSISLFSEVFIFTDYKYYNFIEYLKQRGIINTVSEDSPITGNSLLRALNSISPSTIQSMNSSEREMLETLRSDIEKRGIGLTDNVLFKMHDNAPQYRARNSLMAGIDMENIAVYTTFNSTVPHDTSLIDTLRSHEWKGTSSVIGRTFIGYGHGENYIIAGRVMPQWGSGVFDNMFLSERTFSPDGIMFHLTWLIFDFSYYTAFLSPGHRNFRFIEDKRFGSFHKLGLRLTDNNRIVFKEAIIYSGPLPESYYLNPLAFYYFTQWNSFGDDNIIWSVEWLNQSLKGWPFSLEIFIDDFQYDETRPFNPDKIGILANASVPLGFMPNAYMDIEYALLTKWTGTHQYPDAEYRYYDSPLCYFTGPDSDLLGFELHYFFRHRIELTARYYFSRKGEGTLSLPFEDEGGNPHPEFPSGIVQKTHHWSAELLYRVNRNFDAAVNMEIEKYSNFDNITGNSSINKSIGIKGVYRL